MWLKILKNSARNSKCLFRQPAAFSGRRNRNWRCRVRNRLSAVNYPVTEAGSSVRLYRQGEGIRVEIVVVVLSRVESMEGRDEIRLAREIRSRSCSPVPSRCSTEYGREAGLETRDARDCPSIQELALCPVVLRNGKLPQIADDESMSSVEQGQGTIAAITYRFQDVLKARGVVDRLAPGICQLELQAMSKSLFQ